MEISSGQSHIPEERSYLHENFASEPTYSKNIISKGEESPHGKGSDDAWREEQEQENALFHAGNGKPKDNVGVSEHDPETDVLSVGDTSSANHHSACEIYEEGGGRTDENGIIFDDETPYARTERGDRFSVDTFDSYNSQEQLVPQRQKVSLPHTSTLAGTTQHVSTMLVSALLLAKEVEESKADKENTSSDVVPTLQAGLHDKGDPYDNEHRFQVRLQDMTSSEGQRFDASQESNVHDVPAHLEQSESSPFRQSHGPVQASIGEVCHRREGFQKEASEGSFVPVLERHGSHRESNGDKSSPVFDGTEDSLGSRDHQRKRQEDFKVDAVAEACGNAADVPKPCIVPLNDEASMQDANTEAQRCAPSKGTVLQDNTRTQEDIAETDTSGAKTTASGNNYQGELDTRKDEFCLQSRDDREASHVSVTTRQEQVSYLQVFDPRVLYSGHSTTSSSHVYYHDSTCESIQGATHQHERRPEKSGFLLPLLQRDLTLTDGTVGMSGNVSMYPNVEIPTPHFGTYEEQVPLACFPGLPHAALPDSSGHLLWQPLQGDTTTSCYGPPRTFHDTLYNPIPWSTGVESTGVPASHTADGIAVLKPFYWQSSFHEDRMCTVPCVTLLPANSTVPVDLPDEGGAHGSNLFPAPLQKSPSGSFDAGHQGFSSRDDAAILGGSDVHYGGTLLPQTPFGRPLLCPLHGDWRVTHLQASNNALGSTTTVDTGVLSMDQGNQSLPPFMSASSHHDSRHHSRTGVDRFYQGTDHLHDGNVIHPAPAESDGAGRTSATMEYWSQEKMNSSDAICKDGRPILGRPTVEESHPRHENQTSRKRSSKTECRKRGAVAFASGEPMQSPSLQMSTGVMAHTAPRAQDFTGAPRTQRIYGATDEKGSCLTGRFGGGYPSHQDTPSNSNVSTALPSHRQGWRRPVFSRWDFPGCEQRENASGTSEWASLQTSHLHPSVQGHGVGPGERVDSARTSMFPQGNPIAHVQGNQAYSQDCPVHGKKGVLTAHASSALPSLQQNLQSMEPAIQAGRQGTASGNDCLPPSRVWNPVPPSTSHQQIGRVNDTSRQGATKSRPANGWMSKSATGVDEPRQSTAGFQQGMMTSGSSQSPRVPFPCPSRTYLPSPSFCNDASTVVPRPSFLSMPPPSLPCSSPIYSNVLQMPANTSISSTGMVCVAPSLTAGSGIFSQPTVRQTAPYPMHGPFVTRSGDPVEVTQTGHNVVYTPSHPRRMQPVRTDISNGSSLSVTAEQRRESCGSVSPLQVPGDVGEVSSSLFSLVEPSRRHYETSTAGPSFDNSLLEWLKNPTAPARGKHSVVSSSSYIPPNRISTGRNAPCVSGQMSARCLDYSTVKITPRCAYENPVQALACGVGTGPSRGQEQRTFWQGGVKSSRRPTLSKHEGVSAAPQGCRSGAEHGARKENGFFPAAVKGTSHVHGYSSSTAWVNPGVHWSGSQTLPLSDGASPGVANVHFLKSAEDFLCPSSRNNIACQTYERAGVCDNYQGAVCGNLTFQSARGARSLQSHGGSKQIAFSSTSHDLERQEGNQNNFGFMCGADTVDVSPQVVDCLTQMYLENPRQPSEKSGANMLRTTSLLEPSLTLRSKGSVASNFDGHSSERVDYFMPDCSELTRGALARTRGPSEVILTVGDVSSDGASQRGPGLVVNNNLSYGDDTWVGFHSNVSSSPSWQNSTNEHRRCDLSFLSEGAGEDNGRNGREGWRRGGFF